MKILEYKYLADTLVILFDHFRRNNIQSCWSRVEEPGILLRTILDSSMMNFDYNEHTCSYGIDYDYKTDDEACYYYIFGNEKNADAHSLLIDAGKTFSFIHLVIDAGKGRHLPLVRDFLDAKGCMRIKSIGKRSRLVKLHDEEIMSMEDLKAFLEVNSCAGSLTWIEVE